MLLLLKEQKKFRLFFLAEIISAFGVGLCTVGSNWYIIDETGNAKLLGIILAVNVLAGFLASPIIGGFSDRYNRRNIILYCYLFQAFFFMFITIFLLVNGFSIYIILLFSGINGIGWTTYIATSRSMVKQMLAQKYYSNANSLLEISMQTGMFTAGGVAGILYELQGFEIILALTILSFFTSIFLLSKIQMVGPKKLDETTNFLIEYIEGWKYLKINKIIFIFGFISTLPLVFTMLLNTLMPGYVSNIIGLNATAFGFADMLYGIGGMLSGLTINVWIKVLKPKIIILILYLIVVLVTTIFSIFTLPTFLFVGMFLLGIALSSVRIIMNTAIMKTVADQYIGRSLTIWSSLSLLLQSVATIALGNLIIISSEKIGFVIIIIISVIIFIVLLNINKKDIIKYH